MYYGEGQTSDASKGTNRPVLMSSADAQEAMSTRAAPTVTTVLGRAAEVSSSINAVGSQASELADRLDRLVSNLTGPLPPEDGSDDKIGPAPREPNCAIDALFRAVDDLGPQVLSLHVPLTRIARAILRLDHVLG